MVTLFLNRLYTYKYEVVLLYLLCGFTVWLYSVVIYIYLGFNHSCAYNKGGCTQICDVDSMGNRLCRCYDGFTLQADGITCLGNEGSLGTEIWEE